MTSNATLNGLLVAGGVTAAAAVWAAAILLPAPGARAPAPVSAAAPVEAAIAPVVAAPVVPAQSELQTKAEAAAIEPVSSPAPAPAPVVTAARIDPAVFGALTSPSAPPVAPPRVSMLESAGSIPLTSLSLAATPVQSIGATFAEPLAGSEAPELGGASPLDGPADAGLEDKVAKSEFAEAPNDPPAPRGKIIVIDASEGTKLDPLRQKNWDLNAVQVIPQMTPSSAPKR